MRSHLSLCTLAGVLFITTPSFASPRYIAADDTRESMLCVSAATDKPVRFRMNQEESGYKLRSLSNNVICNGAPIGEFAQAAGNSRNAGMLLRFYKPRGIVEIREAEAASAVGNQWTQVQHDAVILVGGRRTD